MESGFKKTVFNCLRKKGKVLNDVLHLLKLKLY